MIFKHSIYCNYKHSVIYKILLRLCFRELITIQFYCLLMTFTVESTDDTYKCELNRLKKKFSYKLLALLLPWVRTIFWDAFSVTWITAIWTVIVKYSEFPESDSYFIWIIFGQSLAFDLSSINVCWIK